MNASEFTSTDDVLGLLSRRDVLGPLGAIPVPEAGDVVRIGIPVSGWQRRRRRRGNRGR